MTGDAAQRLSNTFQAVRNSDAFKLKNKKNLTREKLCCNISSCFILLVVLAACGVHLQRTLCSVLIVADKWKKSVRAEIALFGYA